MPATYANTSMLTGQTHVMEIDEWTQEQFDARLKLWQDGMLIQEAFPELNEDQREFIMTGITPDEWAEMVSNRNDNG